MTTLEGPRLLIGGNEDENDVISREKEGKNYSHGEVEERHLQL
jgi:hypothetical protein